MDELKNRLVVRGLLKNIESKIRDLNPSSPLKIMEVCGTHTMALHRHGLKRPLSDAGIEMLSGPGCPVCITPNEIHEQAIALATEREGLILTTFGDMTRVPTGRGSLQTAVPAPGSRVKLVYSPEEALEIARAEPGIEVVFFGVGFETTIPGITLTVRRAFEEGVDNFSVLTAFWLVPPPLRAIASAPGMRIEAFLYPGHVSAVIGARPYRFLSEEFGIPGAIAGFEPGDILLALSSILDQMARGRPEAANAYGRVVRRDGNPAALRLMEDTLRIDDAHWRGLGLIPKSGMRLKPEYARHDAKIRYDLHAEYHADDLPGCRCGEILQGKISPPECPLFGNRCRPETPQGPCMVSYEGSCLAHFKYRA